jgi:uncharacterized protein (TIGR00369 family)
MHVQPDSWFARTQNQALAQAPISQLLNASIEQLDLVAESLIMNYQGLADFINPAGCIQGGMLVAMLDDAMATLAQVPLAHGCFAPTLSMNVNFLRSAKTGSLQVRALFVRRGKDIFCIEGNLYQGENLVATASALSQVKSA